MAVCSLFVFLAEISWMSHNIYSKGHANKSNLLTALLSIIHFSHNPLCTWPIILLTLPALSHDVMLFPLRGMVYMFFQSITCPKAAKQTTTSISVSLLITGPSMQSKQCAFQTMHMWSRDGQPKKHPLCEISVTRKSSQLWYNSVGHTEENVNNDLLKHIQLICSRITRENYTSRRQSKIAGLTQNHALSLPCVQRTSRAGGYGRLGEWWEHTQQSPLPLSVTAPLSVISERSCLDRNRAHFTHCSLPSVVDTQARHTIFHLQIHQIHLWEKLNQSR